MKLALFDFDGTISKEDSLLSFLRFSTSNIKVFLGTLLLSPFLLGYVLGIQSNHKTKERVFKYFFQSWSFDQFQKLCSTYAEQTLPTILRDKALEKIQWHQAQGHRVIVVSASIENYLKPWCESLNIELLSTQLHFSEQQHTREQIFTGTFSSPNCYGSEKVNRIQAHLELSNFEHIYAYGDSEGDTEMLALADEAHYKPFT